MALAHAKFTHPENFGYSFYLLREDDGTDYGPVIGISAQIRQHRWHLIWPWKEHKPSRFN